MNDEATDKPASESTNDPTEAPASEAAPETKPAAEKPAAPLRPGDWAFLAGVSIVTAALDLWSKAWATAALSGPKLHPPPLCTPGPGQVSYDLQRMRVHTRPIIHDLLEFEYAENCGGAWGLLHGASEAVRRPFFLLVTVGAIAFIVHLYRGLERGQTATKWALPLVLGGAIGNLVDRVRLGYVVDFIHMHWRGHHWPTYNVADIAITVGIGLMLLEYVIGPQRARKVPAAAKRATA